MLRLRIPGGILTAHQMRGLAAMAADWGSGRVPTSPPAPTCRFANSNRKNIVRVLNKLQSLGLDLARFGRRQHSQHHRVAHHRARSD